ncbi:hypothetical protein [Oceanobacillus caeni]|uniref:Transposase n=1 Tax=Oceanobacillus caeni TaxID=405946 RepID=A0ABR5MIS2_9BACI|nr:hypothetical protein [Oceanobacillus caeni]KPH74551.1 hypothetical protein AFL42_10030 [Oceanobacillus caeni]MED4475326.1 hypothetical protein [Oceanobacillus caeni]
MNEEVAKLPKEEADRILELPNSYLEKGIEIGKENEREKVVQNMLKKVLPVEQIAELLGIIVKNGLR